MKKVICNRNDLFGPWIAERLGFPWFYGRGQTIGLFDEAKGPVGGCLFEGYNGASILVHVAGGGSRNWANKEFLWFCCFYPFEQLGVQKVIAPVESANLESVQWTEKFGFSLEATLKDAAPKGDLLIYTLIKENCRWLSLKDSSSGKTLRPASS